LLGSRPKPPYKWQVYFRFDPALLIVSLTWHETNVPFGSQFFDHMRLRYNGHEDSVSEVQRFYLTTNANPSPQVMLVQWSIKDYYTPQKPKKKGSKRVQASLETHVTQDIAAVTEFMKRFATAKIVVVLDTHSLDNGYFAWKGSSPTTYEGCSLQEVHFSGFRRSRLQPTPFYRSSITASLRRCISISTAPRRPRSTPTGASSSISHAGRR